MGSTYLKTNNHGLQIQYWLPVLSQYVQADIPFQINIGVVDLLCTLDFGRLVGKALADRKCEVESATFVHSFVWLDSEGKIQGIIGIR